MVEESRSFNGEIIIFFLLSSYIMFIKLFKYFYVLIDLCCFWFWLVKFFFVVNSGYYRDL